MNSPENDNPLDYIAPHIKIVKISVSDPVSFRPDPDPFSKKPDPDPGSRMLILDLYLSKFVHQFCCHVLIHK